MLGRNAGSIGNGLQKEQNKNRCSHGRETLKGGESVESAYLQCPHFQRKTGKRGREDKADLGWVEIRARHRETGDEGKVAHG